MLNNISEISKEVKKALVFKVELLADTNSVGSVNVAHCKLTGQDGKSAVFTVNFGSSQYSKGTVGIGYFTEYQRYKYVNNERTDQKNGMGLFCSYIDEEEQAE